MAQYQPMPTTLDQLQLIRLLVELAAPMLESPELEEAWELHRMITAYLKETT